MKPKRRVADTISLLKKAGIFSTLHRTELAMLARYSEYRSFEKDETIFAQGSEADELYLIESGEVIVRTQAEGGEGRDLARFIAGEAFAEMDLLDSVPRAESAFAEAPSTLLVFPSRGLVFRDLLEKHPEVFAPILYKLLGQVAGRIRGSNKLLSEKTPWLQELRRKLHRDTLTGLYNRTWLEEELPGLLRRWPITSVLMIKPDGFKVINDTFGHEAGDKTLRLIASTVSAAMNDEKRAARYRGDEYCVVLPDTEMPQAVEAARALAEAIGAIDLSTFAGSQALKLGVSIGISTFPTHAKEAKELVTRAFDKMFEARNSGGGRIAGD